MHKFDIKNLEKLDNPKRRQSMPPEEILRKFGIGEKGILLDIGCGIGYFSIPAANILREGNVIGLDIVPEIISIAEEKASGLQNIEFRKSEEYSFPVDTASVDHVFICNVIHEVEDKQKYFDEIKRVLKTDGFLCIIDWEKKFTEKGPSVNERISKEEVISLGNLSGLQILEDIHINADHYGLKFKLI